MEFGDLGPFLVTKSERKHNETEIGIGTGMVGGNTFHFHWDYIHYSYCADQYYKDFDLDNDMEISILVGAGAGAGYGDDSWDSYKGEGPDDGDYYSH